MRAAHLPVADQATRAFLAADFDAVLSWTDDEQGVEALVVRSRALLRMNRAAEAFGLLESTYARSLSQEQRVVVASLAACAALALRRPDDARAWLNTARPATWPSPYARSSYGYAAALVNFCSGDHVAASSALPDARALPDPDTRVRALTIEAHLHAARGDLAGQAQLLTACLATPGQRDVYGRANVIHQLSWIVRETREPVDVLALGAAFAALPWTSHVQLWRYVSGENLAWHHALDGSYLRAYQYLERAIADAPSAAWTATSHADYAQFALAAKETVTAGLHLERALAVIDATDWSELGEERFALLDVAALLSERDPQRATALLATFDQIAALSPLHTLAHDERAQAVADFAHGVQRPHDAARLESAYAVFRKVGYTWRAAQTAAALSIATGRKAWHDTATAALGVYPRSWIARDFLDRTNALHTKYPALTPRQLRVAQLLAIGLSDREIAERLNCTYNTARAHVGAVLKRTGAHSRRFLYKPE